jgi:hypothetical protein
MALIASKYISKPFGDYTLKVCKKTKYIDGLHLFKTYNDTYEVQKIMKRMIEYIGRATFSKQVNADFDHIANKKLLNYTFLQKLCVIRAGRNFGPALITAETSIDELKELPKDIKFQYMVREKSTKNGNAKTISQLDIHPMSAIGVAMWLSPSFGNIILVHMKLQLPDMLIYLDNKNTTLRLIIPKEPKINTEEKISDRLSIENNGTREVYTKSGHRIDVLTDDYIIEVKCFANRIKAFWNTFIEKYSSNLIKFKNTSWFG